MIRTNDYVFVLNPHAGSRSLVSLFQGIGYEPPESLHPSPEEIPKDDLPVYAMIRDTVDWVMAYYWPVSRKVTLDRFLREGLVGPSWMPGRVNPYGAAGIVDKFYALEDGLKGTFLGLGVKPPAVVPHHGDNSTLRKRFPYSIDQIRRIVDQFRDDHLLYLDFTGESEETYFRRMEEKYGALGDSEKRVRAAHMTGGHLHAEGLEIVFGMSRKCKWRQAESGLFLSQCFKTFPSSCEGFKYCPECGEEIELVRPE